MLTIVLLFACLALAATVKLEAYYLKDSATEEVKAMARCWDSADLRGDYVGKDVGGHNTTLGEKEYGPEVTTNAHIEEVLADAPAWNRQTDKMLKGLIPGSPFIGLLKKVFDLSDDAGLRLCVKDS